MDFLLQQNFKPSKQRSGLFCFVLSSALSLAREDLPQVLIVLFLSHT